MRRKASFIALAIVAVVAALGLVGPAGAGGGSENEVVVEKVVSGPVPAGAQFEVEVSCLNQDNGHGEPMVTTLTFDETGAPVGANSVVLGAASATCTVTETVTNGATVSYACAASLSHLGTDGAETEDVAPVSCTDDQTVQFVDIDLAVGTVTVTNTFAEEPEPEPEPEAEADAAAAPAGVVAATPTFTG